MRPLLSRFIVEPWHYQFNDESLLGSTSWSSTYKAVISSTGGMAAIKLVKGELLPWEQASFMRKLEILLMNDHPAALSLVGFSLYPMASHVERGPIIITPFMPNGTMGDLLMLEHQGNSPPGWNATTKAKCVFGIAAGMAYLHSREVMHRDLTPENVFLNDKWEPVIGGFEQAKCCSGDTSRTMGCVGTLLFIAPEILLDEGDYSDVPAYGVQVDVYSFGVLLYMMFSPGATPKFPGDSRPRSCQYRMMHTGRGERYERLPVMTDYYWATIQRCWSQSSSDRPSFADLVAEFRKKHEYVLEGADMNAVMRYEDFVAPSGKTSSSG
jgi:serine/threonine protein kinase